MTVLEYNSRIKASLHRQNDQLFLMANQAFMTREAQRTEQRGDYTYYAVPQLTDLYNYQRKRDFINGVTPSDLLEESKKQEAVLSRRERAIEAERKVREYLERKEVSDPHGGTK